MTPKFAALVNPIFHYVLSTAQRLEKREPVDLWRERSIIKSLLDQAETTAADPEYPVRQEHFRIAKRGLVFWTDEILKQADVRWRETILERDYYGTNNGGYLFYVEGETARAAHPDLAELWYLMLVLGFRGGVREAYEYHLKRALPGGTTDEARVREALARDLGRDIRSAPPSPPAAEPLTGDVRPLRGAAMARGAWQLVALLVVVALLLGGLIGWRAAQDATDTTTARPAMANRDLPMLAAVLPGLPYRLLPPM